MGISQTGSPEVFPAAISWDRSPSDWAACVLGHAAALW